MEPDRDKPPARSSHVVAILFGLVAGGLGFLVGGKVAATMIELMTVRQKGLPEGHELLLSASSEALILSAVVWAMVTGVFAWLGYGIGAGKLKDDLHSIEQTMPPAKNPKQVQGPWPRQ